MNLIRRLIASTLPPIHRRIDLCGIGMHLHLHLHLYLHTLFHFLSTCHRLAQGSRLWGLELRATYWQQCARGQQPATWPTFGFGIEKLSLAWRARARASRRLAQLSRPASVCLQCARVSAHLTGASANAVRRCRLRNSL